MKKRAKDQEELKMGSKVNSRINPPASASEKPDLTSFFRLAREKCADYSEIGPFKMKHYCCQEPIKTNHQCRLSHDIPCTHFEKAVLPLDQELQHEWLMMQSGASWGHVIQSRSRICRCGKRFKPRSNRQELCPDCSKANRRRLNRDAVRRHALKRAPPNTFETSS